MLLCRRGPKMLDWFDEIFTPLHRLPSWNVQKGHGSFLTFEFGQPSLEIGQVQESWPTSFGFACGHRSAFVHGDWHLWIYMCAWRMRQDGNVICESDSDEVTIARGCGVLNGQALSSVVVPTAGTTIFRFDLGGLLECIRYPDHQPEDNLWHL